jgi:hypothetical protein
MPGRSEQLRYFLGKFSTHLVIWGRQHASLEAAATPDIEYGLPYARLEYGVFFGNWHRHYRFDFEVLF